MKSSFLFFPFHPSPILLYKSIFYITHEEDIKKCTLEVDRLPWCLKYVSIHYLCYIAFIFQVQHMLQFMPLSENASTSLGRSLASMILNPVELPFWVSCSSFVCPKAQPTGIPSIYALQACKIYLLRRLKCSSTSASKCCTSVNQPKVLCRSAK